MVCQKVLSNLPQRQKQVIERRFGLKNNRGETLASIGKEYGITRERVRQIENEAFAKLKAGQRSQEAKKAFVVFASYLSKNGGLKREDALLENLGGSQFQNQVQFLLRLGNNFHRFSENDVFFSFWTREPSLEEKAKQVLNIILSNFRKVKEPLSEEKVYQINKSGDKTFVKACLEASKLVEKGPLGGLGLVVWPEIKPRGVKDAAFLALKKAQEPLHFRDIAKKATALTKSYEKGREVLAQTVHNELIRDPRFVLVGRGVYGLQEWGYLPGTVKQIIAAVLQKAKRPLDKAQIIQKVREQRLVKENTILLNLSDRNYFKKTPQGRYAAVNNTT